MFKTLSCLLLFTAVTVSQRAAKLTWLSPMPNIINATNSSRGENPVLKVAAFVNYGGFIAAIGPICTEGIRFALNAAQRASILPEFDVSFNAYDDLCDNTRGVNLVMKHLNDAAIGANNFVPLVMGPVCGSGKWMAPTFKFYNTVSIAEGTTVGGVSVNRRFYASFYSIGSTMHSYPQAIASFLIGNGWRNVYLFSEINADFAALEDAIILYYNAYGGKISGTTKVVKTPGQLPTQEFLEIAVRELAKSEARVVILHTAFSAMVICWLHRYGLYGSAYVYLFYGAVYFLPNTIFRDPACTDQMIADVLPSLIHYDRAMPYLANPETAVDEFGTTAPDLEQALRETIERPELNDKWFTWRASCYDSTVAVLTALNRTENLLRQRGDTLANWLTGGENYRKNGSYIQDIMRKVADGLHTFKSLTKFERVRLNSRVGVIAFYQMQFNESAQISSRSDLVAAFSSPMVASFDTTVPKPQLVLGPGRYKWRTANGNVPYDSIRTFAILEPLIPSTIRWILYSIAVLLIIIQITVGGTIAARWKNDEVVKSLPVFNLTSLFGSFAACLSIFVWPDGFSSSHVNCMVASVMLLTGHALVSNVILAKMHVAYLTMPRRTPHYRAASMTTRFFSRFQPTQATMKRQMAPTSAIGPTLGAINDVARQNSINTSRSTIIQPKFVRFVTVVKVSPEQKRNVLVSVFVMTFLQLIVAILWFSIQPLETASFNRRLVPSSDDISVRFQSFTFACMLASPPESSTVLAFIGALLISYGCVLLRSLYYAFLQRKANVPLVNDLHLVRTVSYCLGFISIAGAVAIWLFFANEPGMLQLSISILTLTTSTICTVAIYSPKLKLIFKNEGRSRRIADNL